MFEASVRGSKHINFVSCANLMLCTSSFKLVWTGLSYGLAFWSDTLLSLHVSFSTLKRRGMASEAIARLEPKDYFRIIVISAIVRL